MLQYIYDQLQTSPNELICTRRQSFPMWYNPHIPWAFRPQVGAYREEHSKSGIDLEFSILKKFGGSRSGNCCGYWKNSQHQHSGSISTTFPETQQQSGNDAFCSHQYPLFHFLEVKKERGSCIKPVWIFLYISHSLLAGVRVRGQGDWKVWGYWK